ncbi:FAD-dependent oxidoreductase [Gandjariella thermophila]|uniref:ferredoxin--NADP(+) reductase n=1 Tax=Gandjariella thermophila TaxID=1931992 RepID=A0A4D4IWF8_9PSEU|nr:FAD-dependent oxidoreductase [Gandjariella thermophila]GDY28521.1 NADP oxidoreductase [Gandjariella thermophila]
MSESVRVAVIGSGPAGLYAADELCKHGGVTVDILDRLPCPYGLLRYGVAPDHLKMKSMELTLRKVFERPEVRFLGGVELGGELGVADLTQFYDAIVYATGSAADRRLNIPGEDLEGSLPATEFVAWYCGHPDAAVDRIRLDVRTAVVVGVGNVAVDVTRILAKTADELREKTDIPDHVLDVLAASTITDIHMVGRRGPAQAKFTTKELRELGELANADVIVDPDELVLDEAAQAAVDADKVVRRNLDVLREWAQRPLSGRPRRIYLRFLRSPVAVLGTGRVEGVVLERNTLDPSGRVVGTGETETLPAQLIVRSVGYRGVPLPGVPFDERAGVIPHDGGRVLRDGTPAVGEYVVGWIKRGPTGVIGTNKSDAKETVATLLGDLDALPRAPHRDPDGIVDLLERRGARVVTWEGWQAIEAAERALGAAAGRNRVKITEREALLVAAKARAEDS